MAEGDIYARVRPASVDVKETYTYDREISHNAYTAATNSPPVGSIEIVVPYDGLRYFTREAVQDIENQVSGTRLNGNINGTIGFLAIENHNQTDLQELSDLNYDFGTIPIRMPISGNGITNLNEFLNDRHACVVTLKYSPMYPHVIPIDINMNIFDEDVFRYSQGMDPSHVESQIARDVNFRRNLTLMLSVRLNLPAALSTNSLNPKISEVSLRWPTITSLRGIRLYTGENESRVTYNPLTGSFEWADVELKPEDSSGDNELKTYVSPTMYLEIDQPGELYKQNSIDGKVTIELQRRLLSGMGVQLYDATGTSYPQEDIAPKMTTRIVTNVKMIPEDIFAGRTLSPYQSLHFDEVIPNEMRMTDIRTALADQGFRFEEPVTYQSEQGQTKHFIRATQNQSFDDMVLLIFVEGNRYNAQRETEEHGRGRTFTSTVESGDIKVYLRGVVTGNSDRLMSVMNSFHSALRSQFDRLRAPR